MSVVFRKFGPLLILVVGLVMVIGCDRSSSDESNGQAGEAGPEVSEPNEVVGEPIPAGGESGDGDDEAGGMPGGIPGGLPRGLERVYEENFDGHDPGPIPEAMVIRMGGFEVVHLPESVGGDGGSGRAMMLPGVPLHEEDTGVLFGPNVTAGLRVEASFYAERTGRRYPRFGVGMGGDIYRLRVVPAAGEVQLFRYNELTERTAYRWSDQTWTRVVIELHSEAEGTWLIRGKAWPADEDEPTDWSLTYRETDEPWPGQAAIWATPFSGKPIYIDEIRAYRLP